MSKFLNFKQFINESFIEDIFRGAHAAIDKKDLQPLKKFIGKPKFPTQEEVDAACKFLKIDPEYLFYDKNNMLNSIIYWKGTIFYGFFGGLNMEALKMTRADKFIEQMNKMYNEASSKKDFSRLFMLVDKKILIPTYIELYNEIPDDQKYDIFTDLYIRSEFGFGMFPKEIIDDVFSKRKLSSEWKDRMKAFKKIAKLNDDGTITVYRGEGSKSTKGGMSWTLQRKTAKFFADRFDSHGKIVTKKIKPEQALDYLSDRGEAEVLITP